MDSPHIQQALILLGMHRSMTSLVARTFQESGLFIGDDLIGAGPGNPDGHFESSLIVDFHQTVIRKHHLSSWWWGINESKALQLSLSDQFLMPAKTILDSFPKDRLIGWKDPRTPFFIRGWQKLIPESRYVIIFRHPVACVHSLIRRSMRGRVLKFRPFLATRYFNLWERTNRSLLSFYQEFQDRCVILHMPDHFFELEYQDRLNHHLVEYWNLPLRRLDFKSTFKADYVNSPNTTPSLERLYRKRNKTIAIYEALCEAASSHEFR